MAKDLDLPASPFGEALFNCINMLGSCAAPRVFESWRQEQPMEEIQQTIFIGLDGVEQTREDLAAAREAGDVPDGFTDEHIDGFFEVLVEVRAAAEALSETSEPLGDAARAALATLGVPDPPEGWDTWEPNDEIIQPGGGHGHG